MTHTDILEKRLHETLHRQAELVTINPNAWQDFQNRLADGDAPASGATNTAHVTDLADRRSSSEAKKLSRYRKPLLVAAAAAIIGGGAALIGSSLTSNPAYASWGSTPGALSATEAQQIAVKCHLQPLILDRRGNNVFAMGQVGLKWANCLATLPGRSDEGLGMTYFSDEPKTINNTRIPSSAHPLTVMSVKAPEGNHVSGEPQPVSFVSGRVAQNVTRVVMIANKGEIRATVRNGYFAAWWPGNDTDTATVRAYGADGKELAHATHLTRP